MSIHTYNHEVEFTTSNEDDFFVRVHVTFNIEKDEVEVLRFSQLTFKKCYNIELGHITATITGTNEPYTPTQHDLKEWARDIERALQKEFERQTA